MRRVRARVLRGEYRSGASLRVYGPGATGSLDSSAAMPTGSVAVQAYRSGTATWCEDAWAIGNWCDERSLPGWCRAPWAIDAWCIEPAASAVRSREVEYGSAEFGAQAIDAIGQDSGAMTVGAVLVVAAPAAPRVDAMVVGSGLVTITVGDPIE